MPNLDLLTVPEPVAGPDVPDAPRVTHRVRELRLAAGLTQKELARRLGWTHTEVAKLELGHRRLRQEHLVALAPILGQAPEVIAGGHSAPTLERLALEGLAARVERLERELAEMRAMVARGRAA